MSVLSSCVAAIPFASIGAPSIAADLPSVAGVRDRDLLQVAAQIFDIQPRYIAARDASWAASEAFESDLPSLPDALFWRFGDPVRYGDEVKIGGRTFLSLDLAEIPLRAKKPRLHWRFVGSDAEFQNSKESDFDRLGYPRPNVAHLWEGYEKKRDAARLKEIYEAYVQWTRERDERRLELRVDEFLDAYVEIDDKRNQLVQRLLTLRANTLEGMRAKAAVFSQVLVEPEETLIEGDAYDLMHSLIDDLGGQYPLQIA